MKKLIFILFILISFIGFSQEGEDINANYLKLDNMIYGTKSGSIDTIIAIHPDSIGQFKFKNVTDPVEPLDAVNLRYLNSTLGIDSTMLIQTLSTSITYGGELSINGGDNTKFDIAAGSGYIVDSYTDDENPTFTNVTWTAKTAVTPTYLATNLISYVAIDVNGDVLQSATVLTNEQRQEYILIGVLVHFNLTNINNVGGLQMWNQNQMEMWRGFIYSLDGRVNIEGNEFTANGANLTIDKSIGKIYGIGVNYDDNKKDHNVIESAASAGLTFLRAYRGTPTNITSTTLIDPANYDPDGTGLEAVPTNYYTVQFIYFDVSTGITVVQYGQYRYDSMKKAADAADKDKFTHVPELEGVLARGAIVVKHDATDLSDPLQAKFIDYGALGRVNESTLESYSRFADASNIVNGLTNTRQDIYFTESAGTVYFEVEDEDGNDLVYTIGGREYALNCTTGSGTGGRAQIALTAGSDDNPRTQYIYVTVSGDAVILNVSESLPSGEFAWVWAGALQTVATFLTDGNKPYISRRLTEAKLYSGGGIIRAISERLRVMGSYTTSSIGPTPTVTIIDNAVGDDSLNFEIDAGLVYQLNRQNMGALQSWDEGIRLMNPFVSANTWSYIYDLNDITTDAEGTAINNSIVNFVFVGNINSADATDINWIGVLVPNGVYGYTDINSALSDNNNTAVTSVPDQAGNTAFLLCRVTLRLKNGVWENLTADELGINYFDLRGVPLGAQSGGIGVPSSQTFDDNNFQVQNASDATKLWKVDVSGVTTATTRTLGIPDANGIIALTSDLTAYIKADGTTPLTADWDAGAFTIQADGIQPDNLTTGYLPYKSASILVDSPIFTDGTNVGIGTESPTQKIHISGSGVIRGLVESTSANAILQLKGGAVGDVSWDIHSGYPNVGDFTIRETGIANYLTIKKTTGNVGIGTTSPDTKTEILNAGDQLKLSYDGANATVFATGIGGDHTITPSGGDLTLASSLTINTIAAETTDVDKFLVSNAGLVKYRTGAEVASDIGAITSTAGDWTGTFDGQEGSYYLARANHTGTQTVSTISDFASNLAGTANTTTFTPTADYHVATKKYVDDNAGLWSSDASGIFRNSKVTVGQSSTNPTYQFYATSANPTYTGYINNSSATGHGLVVGAGASNTYTNLLLEDNVGTDLFAFKAGGDFYAYSLGAATPSNILYYNTGTGLITYGAAGSGGEVNTASSQGSGTSIFYQKSGVDLQFNAIKSENNLISVALDGTSHDVELTMNQGNISIPASQISDFDTEVSNNSSVTANTAKVTNVTTNLSLGTVTATTMDVNSSDGTNATLIEADTDDAGLLGADKWDEIVANTSKVTNATHTGDVTGPIALTIAAGAIDIAMHSASGTPSATTFYRGDNQWATPAGGGNVSTSGTPIDNDYAKFVNGTDIEGRSYSEVKTDLSLNNVENTALSTYTGSGGALDNQYITNGAGYIAGIIEDITPQLGANLDIQSFNIEGADAADLLKLSQITATSTELNYVDGVTSAIQSQLNAKISNPSTVDITINGQSSPEFIAQSNSISSTQSGLTIKKSTASAAFYLHYNEDVEEIAFNSLDPDPLVFYMSSLEKARLTTAGVFQLKDQAGTPTTPASTFGGFYTKGDKPYFISDGGAEYDLSASGGTPGGSDGDIQYNNAGSFGGFGDWDGNTLELAGYASNPTFSITGTTAASPYWMRINNTSANAAFELGIAGAAGQFIDGAQQGDAIFKGFGTNINGIAFGTSEQTNAMILYLNASDGLTDVKFDLNVDGEGYFNISDQGAYDLQVGANGIYTTGAIFATGNIVSGSSATSTRLTNTGIGVTTASSLLQIIDLNSSDPLITLNAPVAMYVASSDPTSGVVDGMMYYNSATDKLRLRANGAWVDLN